MISSDLDTLELIAQLKEFMGFPENKMPKDKEIALRTNSLRFFFSHKICELFSAKFKMGSVMVIDHLRAEWAQIREVRKQIMDNSSQKLHKMSAQKWTICILYKFTAKLLKHLGKHSSDMEQWERIIRQSRLDQIVEVWRRKLILYQKIFI